MGLPTVGDVVPLLGLAAPSVSSPATAASFASWLAAEFVRDTGADEGCRCEGRGIN